MNPLIDKLPETVTIDGAEVPINWDFRVSIRFTDLIENPDIDGYEVMEEALNLYYASAEKIENTEEALEQLLLFYRCGKEEKKRPRSADILSYAHDGGYISAAFLEQYNINFATLGEMHWWKFRALFDSLKDDTQIVKIMGYRGADTGKMSREDREFYKKMQKEYALPQNKVSKERQELLDKIDDALMNGGDVTTLLSELNKE